MADIKLKDLYGDEQSYSGVTELSVPKADGSGRTWYVERTGTAFCLQNRGYVLRAGVAVLAASGIGGFFDGSGGSIDFVFMSNGEVTEGVNEYPVATVIGRGEDGTLSHAHIYVCETLTAEQLQQLGALDETVTATGTATKGWNTAEEQEDGTVSVVHIDEPESVVLSIPLPITFSEDENGSTEESEEAFYALFSLASQESGTATFSANGTQTVYPSAGASGLRSVAVTVDVPEAQLQERAVTVTENGTTEVTPDEGYDGISTLSLTVEVENGGSGGLGAQADWAETDEESPAYIRNKPEIVTAADVTAMLASAGVVVPAAVEDNRVLADDNDDIYTF